MKKKNHINQAKLTSTIIDLETQKKNNELLVNYIKKNLSFENAFIKDKTIFYYEDLNSEELANLLKIKTSSIISFFWDNQENIVQNQKLSEDLLTKFCNSLNFKVKKIEKNYNLYLDNFINELDNDLFNEPKTLIVGVMGHVDHGKTTLIDTVRNTKNQEKEIGGITQKVTIFPIASESNEKTFFFLDTPGHKDFNRLRIKGVGLIDIVVLVIDSKEGVKEQTSEIIDYILENSLPFIVFINNKKLTKNNEDEVRKINSQLKKKGIYTLDTGGDIIVVNGNSKSKSSTIELIKNLELLLDNKKFYTNLYSTGIVINSYINTKSGFRHTELLVQNGSLEVKNYIFVKGKIDQIKSISTLSDNKNKNVVNSNSLITITGIKTELELGDKILVVDSKLKEILDKEKLINYVEKKEKIISLTESKRKRKINVFLFSNTQNSLNSLIELVNNKNKNSDHTTFNINHVSMSVFTDSCLDMLLMTNSILIVYNFSIDNKVKKFIKNNDIKFINEFIIYKIDEFLEEILSETQEIIKNIDISNEVKVGSATVKTVFSFSKWNIAGCRMTEGKFSKSNIAQVWRKDSKVYTGRVKNIQINKLDVKEVKAGQEFGLTLDKFNDFQENDTIVFTRTLKPTK